MRSAHISILAPKRVISSNFFRGRPDIFSALNWVFLERQKKKNQQLRRDLPHRGFFFFFLYKNLISVFHILCNRSSQDDCSEQRERNLLRRLTHVPTNRVKSEQQDGRLASSSRALRSRTPRNTQSRDLSDYRTGLCVASRPPCRPTSPQSDIWGASGGILCAMNWKVGGKPQKGWL